MSLSRQTLIWGSDRMKKLQFVTQVNSMQTNIINLFLHCSIKQKEQHGSQSEQIFFRSLWFIALCFVSAKMAAAPAGLGSSSSREGGGGGIVEGEMADFSPGGKCRERKLWASSGSCSAQHSSRKHISSVIHYSSSLTISSHNAHATGNPYIYALYKMIHFFFLFAYFYLLAKWFHVASLWVYFLLVYLEM